MGGRYRTKVRVLFRKEEEADTFWVAANSVDTILKGHFKIKWGNDRGVRKGGLRSHPVATGWGYGRSLLTGLPATGLLHLHPHSMNPFFTLPRWIRLRCKSAYVIFFVTMFL